MHNGIVDAYYPEPIQSIEQETGTELSRAKTSETLGWEMKSATKESFLALSKGDLKVATNASRPLL